MKFAEIYMNCKDSVSKSLKSLWCTNVKNDSQAAYAERISQIIDDLFASEDSMPIVQCMDSYESIVESDLNEANKLVEQLWQKKYLPYKHQFESWKALNDKTPDGKSKSIVVTTGTGSGKTECFMLPLVADLIRNHKGEKAQNHQIEAIFLYPLNALMEDQKERLSKLLEGTGLTFAVYNSSLAENEGGTSEEGLPGEITNRQDMRKTPPNILLTNPTMLEYMLLRQCDQSLFKHGSLRWIVLDETHTYTGAGATELAMLLRRVIDAFGVNTDSVRFATSSATIGSVHDDEKRKKENVVKLRNFIASLCGQDLEQIEHISGKRISHTDDSVPFADIRKILGMQDYMRLDEVVNGRYTVWERLKILDEWCETSVYGSNALKAKVHYFFRVPDNGLFVKLTEHRNGRFEIYDKIPLDACHDKNNETPYLELVRCTSCGEYFAVAQLNENNTYGLPTNNIEDLFDIQEDEENEEDDDYVRKVLFAITNKDDIEGRTSGNSFVTINGNKAVVERTRPSGEWTVVRNIRKKCPHCHKDLTRKSRIGKYAEEQENSDILEKFHLFRVSGDFIARLISEPVMDQLVKHDGNHLHSGQQFISFVDSRQAAAKSTLGQNLEEEMLWVYSRIFHKLCEHTDKLKESLEKRNILLNTGFSEEDVNKICPANNYITWEDILLLLREDKDVCEKLCLQFLNRSKNSEEVDDDGNLIQKSLNRYLCSLLIEKLANHPRQAAAPETMGLFTTCYPKLEKIECLPEAVKVFNERLPIEKQISIQDWKNLLQIFLDFRVRSDGSITMRLGGEFGELSIHDCKRFKSEEQGRRPARKPNVESTNGQYSNIVLLLAELYGEGDSIGEVIKRHKLEIQSVADALWTELTKNTGLLVDEHQHYRNQPGYEPSYRLNVADIAFKLYDQCCLCDVRNGRKQGVTPRPVALTFKGYSPYIIDGRPCMPLTQMEKWNTQKFLYPYYSASGKKCNEEQLNQWINEHRRILCENIGIYNNKIWGDDGVFATRLNSIYLYPDIFIQAEHTAQIDKVIARKSQEMFKEYDINILACSTTMEMGVDLGSLEFVLMSSVPPNSSNYRQRAGRSGRNDFTRSACATLCKSDSLGLRTYYDPMRQIINRNIAVPTVDMDSCKVILRHINSYLLRSFLFDFQVKTRHNNLEIEIIDFFTRFHFPQNDNGRGVDYHHIHHSDDDNRLVHPSDGIGLEGDVEKTYYKKFTEYLEGKVIGTNGNTIHLNTEGVGRILRGITCVTVNEAIANTKKQIKICYDNIEERLGYIASKYISAKDEGNQKFIKRLKILYAGLLGENLIMHLSTNRFTPNANMPVDIVSFLQNAKTKSVHSNNSDPSYRLDQALRMYAPGNTVVISNRTRVVRGIKYSEDKPKPFVELFYNDNKATLGIEPDNAKVWSVNNKKALTVIQPIAFLADANEEPTRFESPNNFAQVYAQLVDPEDWGDKSCDRLYNIRKSNEYGKSKILYYNNGCGFGYCVCQKCGRTVMEKHPTNKYNGVPHDMNKLYNKNKDEWYHVPINEKTNYACTTDDPQNGTYFRNVLLGAEIQTDYCEIQLKRESGNSCMNKSDKKTLITLGVVFVSKLIEYLDKERNSIDFLITPNGHLCIYDTSTGGSGYSTELIKVHVMNHIINESYRMLSTCKSKDEILDRFTYHYLDDIDVRAALNWLKAALKTYNT